MTEDAIPMLSFRRILLCAAALAAAACTSNPSGGDASDVADGSDAADVVVDDGPPPPPPMLLGPCAQDSDCPNGDMCLTNINGYPGGLCTTPCGSDADCPMDSPYISPVCRPINGHRICVRECLNGFDCGRDGYTCIKSTPTATTGICTPSCSTTNCGAGARCNEWTGLCQDPSITYPPMGADDGQPCMHTGTASECRSSRCILATSASTGAPTGWTNGYCLSECRLTSGWTSTGLYSGDTFPQANCPTGAICFPNSNDIAEDGPGDCLHGCTADTDCRVGEGYYCQTTFGLIRLDRNHNTYTVPHTWMNGICVPVDCLNDTMHHCPTGYTCQTATRNGSMVGICVVGTGTDAGSDGGDAASDTGTDVVTDTGSVTDADDGSTDAALDGSAG